MPLEINRLSGKGWLVAGICLCVSTLAVASDKQSLSEKADVAREESRLIEQEQLQKASEAAAKTQAREKKIYKKMLPNDWEAEQKDKAQKQFNERESRENKYLREAKEAATQERKIPKPG